MLYYIQVEGEATKQEENKMDAVKLASRYTTQELVAKGTEIRAMPENKNPTGSFQRYVPRARRKLEAIDWAITYHLQNRQNGPPGAIIPTR